MARARVHVSGQCRQCAVPRTMPCDRTMLLASNDGMQLLLERVRRQGEAHVHRHLSGPGTLARPCAWRGVQSCEFLACRSPSRWWGTLHLPHCFLLGSVRFIIARADHLPQVCVSDLVADSIRRTRIARIRRHAARADRRPIAARPRRTALHAQLSCKGRSRSTLSQRRRGRCESIISRCAAARE